MKNRLPVCSRVARFAKFVLAGFLAVLLSACGGGGGGGGGAPADLPVDPPADPPADLPVDLPVDLSADPPTFGPSFSSAAPSTASEMISPRPPGTYAERMTAYATSNEYDVSYTVTDVNGVRSTQMDTHLARINAAAAYADGWTGRGQVIAVVDTGFLETHDELDELTGKTAGKRTLQGYTPALGNKGHGTFVASVAAGNRSGSTSGLDMHGVAFDARLHYTEIRLGSGGGVYRPFQLTDYEDSDDRTNAAFYSNVMEGGRAANARIINLSFGVNGAAGIYDRAEVRRRFVRTASILAQTHTYNSAGFRVPLSRPNADKSIFVWAAGNSGGLTDPSTMAAPNHATPHLLAGLSLHFPELQSHSLAVVALDQVGVIASYSNRCGSAASFCIAAPGSGIVGADPIDNNDNDENDDYRVSRGTSFAAPIVSGALAVLAQRFPTLGTDELVTRIKASATKTDRYADPAIYGQGLLNLGAAIAPIGTLSVAGLSRSDSFVSPGSSFGDALDVAFTNQFVTGFDSLNAPFDYSLQGFVKTAPASTLQPLTTMHNDLYAQRDDDLGNASPQNYFTGAGGFALHGGAQSTAGLRRINADTSSHLHLSNGGIDFAFAKRERLVFSAFADTAHRNGTPQVAGLRFAWRPQTDYGFAFGGGYLREASEVLQSEGGGAFGNLSAETLFLAAGGNWEINQWRIHAGAEVGAVLAQGERWFDDLSPLFTSSFSLGTARRLSANDEIRFGLSSPLRIEQGKANLTLPVGRTKNGVVQYAKTSASLTPSGRQIDLTATWQRRLPVGYFTLSARASHDPNHTAAADADLATLASYHLDF